MDHTITSFIEENIYMTDVFLIFRKQDFCFDYQSLANAQLDLFVENYKKEEEFLITKDLQEILVKTIHKLKKFFKIK